MKNQLCEECNKEFTSINNPGMQKRYCTKQCRMKANNKRRIEKLKNGYNINEDLFYLQNSYFFIIQDNKMIKNKDFDLVYHEARKKMKKECKDVNIYHYSYIEDLTRLFITVFDKPQLLIKDI